MIQAKQKSSHSSPVLFCIMALWRNRSQLSLCQCWKKLSCLNCSVHTGS